jgi:peptide chain release factor 2
MQEYLQRIERLSGPLKIPSARTRIGELAILAESPDLWNNQEQAVLITSELAALQEKVRQYDDVHVLAEMAGELDPSDIKQLEQQLQALERTALLSGPYDAAECTVTIHAGTGGTDAQDWALMLERMIIRYIESGGTEQIEDRALQINRSHWKAEILDRQTGEEAGIKRVVIHVAGQFAYGLLQSEHGVHRLVRQSPFNAKGLRQTSFALIEVIPDVPTDSAPVIAESDLQIDVFRSGGAGGQHVNTTDSAVRITHIPSGLVVVVQNERSQHQNKATALKVLASRLAVLQAVKNAEELAILKGEVKEGSWGNQIRSYVLHPYQMVKDHRTDYETSQTTAVLAGALAPFIEAYITHAAQAASHGE